MSYQLYPENLDDLARGAAVLGTGGGGDPHVGRLAARHAMGGEPVEVLALSELGDDVLVAPVSQMGAPTIMGERLPNGDEPLRSLRRLEAHLGRTAEALVAVECGGVNSMMPILLAARTGLPVVDADGMGRAFPELQMKTFGAYGLSGTPAVLTGSFGESALIDTGGDNRRMEQLARGLAIRMGGTAHLCQFTMSGADLKRTAVPGTLGLGLGIGRALRTARERNEDPGEWLGEVFSESDYGKFTCVFTGKVVDVDRRVEGGFNVGSVEVAAFGGPERLTITFQNEFLVASRDGALVATVPDLICVLDVETCEAITTDRLRYGQRVRVAVIGTPPIMRTTEALRTFGPRAFGLDLDYTPVEELVGGGSV